jgi:hypothetical protein
VVRGGWVYPFEKGHVDVHDPLSGRFVPLPEQVRPRMLKEATKGEGPRTEWERACMSSEQIHLARRNL